MRVESLFPRLSSTFGQAKRFARREDGAVAYFSLVIFFLMFLIGGMAVDLMRYEHTRVTLQQTMDRSVLAAASLQQTLAPASVVSDYFAKAGLSDYLDASSIVVTQTMNSRNVKAKASAISYNIFMDMLGVDELEAKTAATAEQRRTNIEIVLVLDVSGSMASNNRLVNLRSAAKSFVDAVLGNDTENRISLAIVPFNGQVNLGAPLRAKYNAIDLNGVTDSNCLDLPASVYSSLTMSRTLPMPMTAFADTFSPTSLSTSYVAATSAAPTATNRWCPATPGNIVRLPSNNIPSLKSQIDGLTAIGATSINAGLKWGLTLLDPAARPMFNEFIGAGSINSAFTGRPFDFGDPENLKVIVLMTDGEHFPEERVNSGYRSGTSPIYKSTGDGNFSIRFTSGRPAAAGTNEYWVPHLCTSTACTNGSNTSTAWRSTPWNSGGGVTQRSWPQVWSDVRVQWVAWQLYARALGTNATTRTNVYNTWLGNFRTLTPTGNMDTQLAAACDLAKNQNVTIYGIAFEAPANGQAAIQNCSSSPKSNYYFNASGLQIGVVFQTIAASISQLRLTQ